MRILHVGWGDPDGAVSGAARVVGMLVTGQCRRGHRVSAFARTGAYAPAPRLRREGRAWGTIWAMPRGPNPFLHWDDPEADISQPAIEKAFRRILRAERPDVVHLHDLAGHAASYASIARAAGAAVVISLHNMRYLCPRHDKVRSDLRPCRNAGDVGECSACLGVAAGPLRRRLAAMRAALGTASAVHAASRFVIAEHLRWGMPIGGKIAMIQFGCDLPRLPPPAGRAWAFAGGGAYVKGAFLLAEALGRLRRASPVVRWFGLSPWSAAARHIRRIAGRRVRIRFDGTYRPEEMPRLFRGVEAVLVPSIFPETFSLVAQEAQALGRPVVAAAHGAVPERVRDGETGLLVPANDPAAFAEALDRLTAAEARRMGAAQPRPPSVASFLDGMERLYQGALDGVVAADGVGADESEVPAAPPATVAMREAASRFYAADGGTRRVQSRLEADPARAAGRLARRLRGRRVLVFGGTATGRAAMGALRVRGVRVVGSFDADPGTGVPGLGRLRRRDWDVVVVASRGAQDPWVREIADRVGGDRVVGLFP